MFLRIIGFIFSKVAESIWLTSESVHSTSFVFIPWSHPRRIIYTMESSQEDNIYRGVIPGG